jgi:hypothetical protein
VCTEHAGALPGGQGGRGERSVEAFAGREVQRFPDELLVRQGDQQRPAGGDEFVEPAADLEGMPGVLAEVMSRIDKSALTPTDTARSARPTTVSITSRTTSE